MRPYKNLAVLALAASSVCPALSAPTREYQKQSRAELEERLSFKILSGAPGAMFAMGALPSLFQRSPGGSSKRATEAVHMREPAQRDVSPAQMAAVLNALDQRADFPPEDLGAVIRLSRALNELD